MSTPDPRLSRRDAERLLDAPAEHDDVLGRALTAASAPAHPRELRREDEAAAAFQAARLAPPPASRSGYVSPSRLGSRAAVRAVVATGAVVALTSGGFALASSTDLPGIPDLPGLPGLPALPGQASGGASESAGDGPGSADGSTGGSGSGSDSDGPAGSSAGSSDASGPTNQSTSPGSPSASPSETSDGPASPTPDFEGLCRAFQASDRSDSGSSLSSAAFLALAAQAGGADRIATYCVDLIGPPKEAVKPTDEPTPTTQPSPTRPTPTKPTPTKPTPTKPTPTKPTPSPGKPTDTPSATPTAIPSNIPSAIPTATPTATPTPGKPSDLPTPDGSGGTGSSASSGNPGKGGGTHASG